MWIFCANPLNFKSNRRGNMNNLNVFTNTEFGTVRIVTIDNEPWLVGKDVADILGYQNGSRDVNRHVDEEDRCKEMVFDGNQNKETILINESGLYSLVLGSKLPTAKKFKRWVTSEVLPDIRKHGMYMSSDNIDKLLNDPDAMIQALTKYKDEREARLKAQEENAKLTADNDRMRPKEIFADAVAASKTSILIGDLAKLICQNGHEIGQRRLFQWMRDNHYLIASGNSTNMPYQRYIEQGLFEIKESNIQNPDGSVRITRTTKVTGKGQVYFINKFLNAEEAV